MQQLRDRLAFCFLLLQLSHAWAVRCRWSTTRQISRRVARTSADVPGGTLGRVITVQYEGCSRGSRYHVQIRMVNAWGYIADAMDG
jgi:DsbC/DsbD-like thiol-disulfide interchange protein